MSSYKEPSFQERTALANKAKQAALEQLRTKPPLDEAVVAERREAAQARDLAQATAREEKKRARAIEKSQKQDRAAEISKAAIATPPSEEEQKAARDAKYAARKNRKR